MASRASVAVLSIAALGVAGGGWYYYRHRAEPTANSAGQNGKGGQAANSAPVPVTLGSATRGDFKIFIEGLGNVQALNNVTVRTRVDGQITKVAFTEGQIVKEGDLLAQIDPGPFQSLLDQAKAKQTQDEALLANAKLDLQRYSKLGTEDFATRQQIDTQQSSVAQATAQVASDKAAVDNAQIQLGYTTIKAPLTGRVGFRLVDQGNIVNASSQSGIVSIQQTQPISVVFATPEADVTRVNRAMSAGKLPVTALSADKSETLSTGELTTINNEVDVASGTIRLKATFANADDALWPGLSVVVRLLVGTDNNALLAPSDAIQHGPAGLYVYVVDDQNIAHVKPVKVSRSDDTNTVVTDGLQGGERVVVGGQYRVVDGGPVSVNTASAGAAATQPEN